MVDWTSLRPFMPGEAMPTRRSVGWYPTVSFLISATAIALASAAAEWVVAVCTVIVRALAAAAVPASRPIAGTRAAKE